jgi:hypothetical protein
VTWPPAPGSIISRATDNPAGVWAGCAQAMALASDRSRECGRAVHRTVASGPGFDGLTGHRQSGGSATGCPQGVGLQPRIGCRPLGGLWPPAPGSMVPRGTDNRAGLRAGCPQSGGLRAGSAFRGVPASRLRAGLPWPPAPGSIVSRAADISAGVGGLSTGRWPPAPGCQPLMGDRQFRGVWAGLSTVTVRW